VTKKPEYQTAGYLLPEEIDPVQVPICVCIPCDRNHALAFLGQLEMLGYWYTWERDDQKRGTQAARVWRQIAADARAELEKCGVFDMGCGCEEKRIIRQYIGDDGHLHVEYSDGTEEIRDDLDPRYSNPTLPPMPGSDGGVKRCVAANSAVTAFQGWQTQELDAMQDGTNLFQTLWGIIVGILGVTIGIPVAGVLAVIAVLIIAVVNWIISQVPEEFEAAFIEQTWQDLLCIFYCEMSEDGSFTEAQWQTVMQHIGSEIENGVAVRFFTDHLNLIGPVGLTNAARSGYGGSRDCGACDCDDTWCYLFDFSADDGDWFVPEASSAFYGAWEAPTGWVATDEVQTGSPDSGNREVRIRRAFSPTNITRVLVTYDFTGGPYGNTSLSAQGIVLDTTLVVNVARSAMIDGVALTREWTGAGTVASEIETYARSSNDGSAPYTYGGNAIIKSIQIEGTGTNPFGEDNC